MFVCVCVHGHLCVCFVCIVSLCACFGWKREGVWDFSPVTSVMQAWVLPASHWPSCSVSAHLHHPCQTQTFIISDCMGACVCVCTRGWENEMERWDWMGETHKPLAYCILIDICSNPLRGYSVLTFFHFYTYLLCFNCCLQFLVCVKVGLWC